MKTESKYSFDEILNQFNKKIDQLVENIDFIKSKVETELKPDTLFTPKEVAIRLKLCERTVYEHLKQGKLKSTRIGKKLYINSQALTDFIQHGTKN